MAASTSGGASPSEQTPTLENPVSDLSDYELRHLAAHLELAGRDDDLHRLLRLQTVTGRNAWFAERVTRRMEEGFIGDVRLAWRIAANTRGRGRAGQGQGVEHLCRYTLMASSTHTRVLNTPTILIAALVRLGKWSYAQALSYARLIDAPVRKTRGLIYLLSTLTEEAGEIEEEDRQALIEEVIAAIVGLNDYALDAKAVLFDALVRQVQGADREKVVRALLDEAQAALAKNKGAYLLDSLKGLYEELSPGQARAAIALWEADEQEPPLLLWMALGDVESAAAIAGSMEKRLADAKEDEAQALRELSEDFALLYARFAAAIPEGFLQKLYAAISNEIEASRRREAILSAHARASMKSHQQTLLFALRALMPFLGVEKADDALRLIVQEWQRVGSSNVELFEGLAAWIPPGMSSIVREAARVGADDLRWADAWITLAGMAGDAEREAMVTELLKVINTLDDDLEVADYLGRVAPLLSPTTIELALEIIERDLSEWLRVQTLLALIFAQPDAEQDPLFSQVIAQVAASLDEGWASYLDTNTLKQIVKASAQMQPSDRDLLFEKILTYMIFAPFVDIDYRESAMEILLPVLPEPLVLRAWQLSQVLDDAPDWLPGLASLFPHLPEEAQHEAWNLAGWWMLGADRAYYHAAFVSAVVPALPEALLPSALQAANGYTEATLRVATITDLYPHLSGSEQAEIVEAILLDIAEMAGSQEAIKALVGLALLLPLEDQQGLLDKAIALIGKLSSKSVLAGVMEKMLPLLPQAQQEEVILALFSLPGWGADGWSAAMVLEVSPFLPEWMVRDLMATLRLSYSKRSGHHEKVKLLPKAQRFQDELWNPYYEGSICGALARRLIDLGFAEEAYDFITEREGDGEQFEGLMAILSTTAPALPPPLFQKAFTRAKEIVAQERVTRAARRAGATLASQAYYLSPPEDEVLATFCPLLVQEGERAAALALASSFEDVDVEAKALASIAATGIQRATAEEQGDLLERIFKAMEELSDYETDERKAILQTLLPAWLALRPSAQMDLLRGLLRDLMQRPRALVINELCLIAPVLAAVGGKDAPRALFAAIADVARWWP